MNYIRETYINNSKSTEIRKQYVKKHISILGTIDKFAWGMKDTSKADWNPTTDHSS